EFGATTANKCFRVLSISSITTYNATAPGALGPAKIDPDCPGGHVTYGQIKSCCEDSDSSSPYNEFHYYKKGILECKVINTADGTLISHEITVDSCDGNKLIERKHDSYHKASFEEYNCPNGCQDGACIREATEEVSKEGVSSNLGGIGAEISTRNGQLIIVALLKDSPAGRAGLLADDKILAINGESTAGVAIVDAIKKISGEIGTNVVLTILRLTDEEEISLVVSVTRAYVAP
ncbi:PDZ domain-containing protein, partial [Patescibacteria group bacterium]|nr:PDZ domain-containing protein [Patescibacteria group bacterium]